MSNLIGVTLWYWSLPSLTNLVKRALRLSPVSLVGIGATIKGMRTHAVSHSWLSPPLIVSLRCSSDVCARWKVCEAIIYPELGVLRPQWWWPQDHATVTLVYRFSFARVHPAKVKTQPGSEVGSWEVLGITFIKQHVLLYFFTSCERVTIISSQNASNDTSILTTHKLTMAGLGV